MTGTRAVTATMLVPLVVAIVWFAPAWMIAIVVGGVAFIAAHELFRMNGQGAFGFYQVFAAICAGGILYGQWAVSVASSRGFAANVWPSWWPGGEMLPLELVICMLAVVVACLALFAKGVVAALSGSAIGITALLFIVFPLSYLVRLREVESIGAKLALLVLCVVWVGDTAAYFVGRGCGKHLLSPAVSPKKTWEGAAANTVSSGLVGWAFANWIDFPVVHVIGAAALASIAGQIGDLFESACKRHAGVKDSGSLLPGHGGMWDRIDALIFATPVIWWYFSYI